MIMPKFGCKKYLMVTACIYVAVSLGAGCGSDPVSPPVTANDPLWKWYHPLPTGNPILDVQVGDKGLCVGSGKTGTVISSRDNGRKWVSHVTGVVEDLWTVSVLDNRTWFVGGGFGNVYRTRDSGLSWENCLSEEESGGLIESIDFIDTGLGSGGIGVASVEGGDFLLTQDGGDSWRRIREGNGVDYYAIVLADKNRIYAVGEDGVAIKSDDLGKTWAEMVTDAGRNISSVRFDSMGNGICVGADGLILETEDWGASWVKNKQAFPMNLYSVSLGAEFDVVVGAQGGVLVRKQGTGLWNVIDVGLDDALLAVGDLGNGRFLLGGGGVYELVGDDGGLSTAIAYTRASLFDICKVDGHGAMAVGEEGKIFLEEDGRWMGTEIAADLRFFGCGGGYGSLVAVGPNGSVYARSDEATTFVDVNSGLNVDLYDVAVMGPGRFVAVGGSGTILISDDGGGSWDTAASGDYQFDISSVSTWGNESCIAVSYYGDVIVSEDGGESWGLKRPVSHNVFNTVAIGENTVFACGSWKISRSMDRGENWEVVYSGRLGEEFYGIDFSSELEGVCVGWAGIIYATDSGGENWVRVPRGTTRTLKGVILEEGGDVTVVGENLSIIKSDFASFF